MLPTQKSRPTAPVTAATRSTNCIESAQSALRSIRAAGVRPSRSNGLQLNDHELRQQVLLQLSKFGPRIGRVVQVDVRRGEVTLSGVVGSAYERSLIDQAVERLAGVQQLSNEIEVHRAEPEPQVAWFGLSALGKSLWKAAAIAGLLVAVAASLLLMFQVAGAGDGDRQPSSFCAARGNACECCMSLEMRR